MTGERGRADPGFWAAAWDHADEWPGRVLPWGPAAAWTSGGWRADGASSAMRRALHAVELALAGLAGADAADWDSPTAAGQYRDTLGEVRAELRGLNSRLDQAAAAIAVHEGAVRLAEDARRTGYAAQLGCGAL